MTEFVVYFTQDAAVTVIVPEADDADDAIELAYDKLPGSLCHQCGRDIDLDGDWSPTTVTDADGRPVWMASKP